MKNTMTPKNEGEKRSHHDATTESKWNWEMKGKNSWRKSVAADKSAFALSRRWAPKASAKSKTTTTTNDGWGKKKENSRKNLRGKEDAATSMHSVLHSAFGEKERWIFCGRGAKERRLPGRLRDRHTLCGGPAERRWKGRNIRKLCAHCTRPPFTWSL